MADAFDRLQWALWLAERGFLIIQLERGSKVPKSGFGWVRSATSSADTITNWFEADPDMNYGVCPSEHHVILDLDNKEGKDGIAYLDGLELEHGQVGETFIVDSPSGGRHLYFKLPADALPVGNAHSFGPTSGIDVRGWHGYVVGPSCELVAGQCGPKDTPGEYAIKHEGDIAEVPNWVRGYLVSKRDRDAAADVPLIPLDLPENIEKAGDFLRTRPPAIQGQNGNQWTYETAQFLRDFGVSEDRAVDLMFTSGWNAKCEPEWDYDELGGVVEHAYRYGQNRPGSKMDMIGLYERMMGDVAAVESVEAGLAPDGFNSHFFTPGTFTHRGKRREFIIPNWLPDTGFAALLAVRGTGKSTIMLDLACRAACDMDWQGTPIKPGYVAVYLCGEDDEGLEVNMMAWQMKNGIDIPEDRMVIADAITNLMSAEDVERWAREIKRLVGDRPAIVFLDTWQRATSYAGQNKDEDMNLCVHHAEALARSLNGPAVIAFHPPKHNDNTIHGSAIIENTSVAIWKLDTVGNGRKLHVERIKGAPTTGWRIYSFEEVELDEADSFGSKIIGIVPLRVGGSEDSGSAEARAQAERVKEGWAYLVLGFTKYEETLDPERRTPESKRTRSLLADKLEGLCKEDEFRRYYAAPLVAEGFKGLSKRSIQTGLGEAFPGDGAFVDLVTEGIRILLNKKSGRDYAFTSKAIPQLSAPED